MYVHVFKLTVNSDQLLCVFYITCFEQRFSPSCAWAWNIYSACAVCETCSIWFKRTAWALMVNKSRRGEEIRHAAKDPNLHSSKETKDKADPVLLGAPVHRLARLSLLPGFIRPEIIYNSGPNKLDSRTASHLAGLNLEFGLRWIFAMTRFWLHKTDFRIGSVFSLMFKSCFCVHTWVFYCVFWISIDFVIQRSLWLWYQPKKINSDNYSYSEELCWRTNGTWCSSEFCMKTHIYYLQALNVSSCEVVVETAISMT